MDPKDDNYRQRNEVAEFCSQMFLDVQGPESVGEKHEVIGKEEIYIKSVQFIEKVPIDYEATTRNKNKLYIVYNIIGINTYVFVVGLQNVHSHHYYYSTPKLLRNISFFYLIT